MKIYVRRSLLNGFLLGTMLSVAIVAVAWAGFTGPNRTTTKEVRDPGGDQWYCDKSGYSRCWFAPGNPCADEGGSHPSGSEQMRVCGWPSPGDSCGCNKAYTEIIINLPPAIVSGYQSCSSPGNNGWCRDGASLDLRASEPLAGELIEGIEGNPGGLLCDPVDASNITCSYTGGGEGNFTIEFWALSTYGDTSEKDFSSWKADGTPPRINLLISGGSAGDGGWYQSGPVDVSVSGTDSVSGVSVAEVSIDNGGWVSSAQVSGDGIHSVGARVIDGAGNQSTDTTAIQIDGTPPSIDLVANGGSEGGGWYRGGTVNLTVNGADAVSGVALAEVAVDGGGWTSSAQVSGDGVHSVNARVIDVAGNQSTDSTEVRIDGTPPNLSPELSGTMGREGLYISPVSVFASASDNHSGVAKVEVSDGSGEWQAGPLVISTDGTHNPWYRAEDIAGNQSTVSAEISIDRTPPNLSPELSGTMGREGWYISPVSIFASASDNHSGVAKVEVSDGSGEWQAGPLQISTDGTHNPWYRAEDVAGNETSEEGPTIKIDTHFPESAFFNPPEGSETWVSGVVSLIGQSSDLTSGLLEVEISFDEGQSWSSLERSGGDWRSSWDSSEMPNGTYVVLARASDIAGNLESTARVTLRVDNLPPFVDIPEKWPVSQAGTLIVEEGGIGLDGVEVVISDGDIILESHQYPADEVPQAVSWDGRLPDGQLAVPGEYPVVVYAWDRVGNKGSDAGWIIVPVVEQAEAPALPAPVDPAEPSKPIPAPAVVESGSETEAEVAAIQAQPWIWPAIAWIGLLSAVGFTKVADPRAKALQSLHEDFVIIRKSLNE